MILYHGMLDKYAHDICENGINLNLPFRKSVSNAY